METDEEQVEKLKAWWKENGRSVIAGVVIGVGGLFGYRGWVDYQTQVAEEASAHFEQMVQALEAGDKEKIVGAADTLIEEYSSSQYAVMARLGLARFHVENGDYDKAGEQLQQVVGTVDNQPLGYVARKRLAAVQLQMSQADQALNTLSTDFPAEFSASVEELKGDIYAQQGKPAEAAEAYRKAQRGTPGPANSDFLQQNLDDLGLTG